MHVIDNTQNIAYYPSNFGFRKFVSVNPFFIQRSASIRLIDDIEAVRIIIILDHLQRIRVILNHINSTLSWPNG